MNTSRESSWMIAGALGGALLMLAQSAGWQVLHAVAGARAGRLAASLSADWFSFEGASGVAVRQAANQAGLWAILCGALLGFVSAVVRCRHGRMATENADSCANLAWLLVLVPLGWSGLLLLVSAALGQLHGRTGVAQVLGVLLDLKVWWGIALLVALERERTAPELRPASSGPLGGAR